MASALRSGLKPDHALVDVVFGGVRGWAAPNLSITWVLPIPASESLAGKRINQYASYLIDTNVVDPHGGGKHEVGRNLR